jgi:uncharacterized membrane protein YphA (DoxX/SURF4 family)
MKGRSALEWSYLTLRTLIGAMFLYAGAMKIFVDGTAEFAESVSHYRILQDPWNLVVAYVLPWAEVIAGLSLLTGLLIRGGLALAAALTGMFLFGIVQGWVRGLDISCGCFGKSEMAVNYPLHVAGLGVLALVLCILRFFEPTSKNHLFGGKPMQLPH